MYISGLKDCFNEEFHAGVSSPVQDTVSADRNLQSPTHYVGYVIHMAENCLKIPLFTGLCKPQFTSKCIPIKEKHLSMCLIPKVPG